MNRRFLNLISRTVTGMYSTNRIDTSLLFNRSTAVTAKDGLDRVSSIEEVPKLERLTATKISFEPFLTNLYDIVMGEVVFSSLGKHKILCADAAGYTVAFDIKSHTLLPMPKMNTPKGPMRMVVSTIPRTEDHALSSDSDLETEAVIRSVSNSDHTEGIYIMDMSPSNPVPFEVFTFSTRGWVWRPLPSPQFFDDPKYSPRWDSCTVVDGNIIYFSPTTTDEDARLIGTYCFDTVTQEWKKAGDWVLPFLGKAEFIPEYGLWLGLSSHSPHHLCAISSLHPPKVEGTFPDTATPKCQSLFDQTIFNLGSGRFCTVKFFESGNNEELCFNTILTGMEVMQCDEGEAGKVKVIRHLSRRVIDLNAHSVL